VKKHQQGELPNSQSSPLIGVARTRTDARGIVPTGDQAPEEQIFREHELVRRDRQARFGGWENHREDFVETPTISAEIAQQLMGRSRGALRANLKEQSEMPKITPFLWFDGQAEQAMNFYASIFRNAQVLNVSRANGQVMSVTFELEDQKFMALNAGPEFKFTEAISFFVNCETQEEVDELWEKLSAGGSKGRCGWLKDKFGLSWQIIPKALGRLMNDPDPEKAQAVVQAMLKMNKIVIEDLERAYEGRTAA
jgi:predicted 3-demethylubiquinone-9 3-methyltransferase (glyoxalase superfamily)